MTAPADLAFVNGAVYTVVPARPRAQAVAVQNGRIVAVGSDDEVRELLGPATDVIDLKGRMLLPGFQDAHIHPASSGLEMLRCNLSNADALSDYQTILAEFAAGRPDEPWILGGGWAMDAFPGGNPPKDALDEVVNDRPVYLTSRDGHSAWVNSKALEIAGVTGDTPDPTDGVIVRAADGEVWGTLHEGALRLIGKLVPEETDDDWIAGLRVAQEYLHSLGITAWQDAIVGIDDASGTFDAYRTFEAYLRFARDGELTARVIGALWWDRHRGEEQIDDLLAARERGSAGRFAATSVKIMQD
ncbi:MAG: amidohydrolase, partial [Actinomycetota bacterium]